MNGARKMTTGMSGDNCHESFLQTPKGTTIDQLITDAHSVHVYGRILHAIIFLYDEMGEPLASLGINLLPRSDGTHGECGQEGYSTIVHKKGPHQSFSVVWCTGYSVFLTSPDMQLKRWCRNEMKSRLHTYVGGGDIPPDRKRDLKRFINSTLGETINCKKADICHKVNGVYRVFAPQVNDFTNLPKAWNCLTYSIAFLCAATGICIKRVAFLHLLMLYMGYAQPQYAPSGQRQLASERFGSSIRSARNRSARTKRSGSGARRRGLRMVSRGGRVQYAVTKAAEHRLASLGYHARSFTTAKRRAPRSYPPQSVRRRSPTGRICQSCGMRRTLDQGGKRAAPKECSCL